MTELAELLQELESTKTRARQDELRDEIHAILKPQVLAMGTLYCWRNDRTELKPSTDLTHACTFCGIKYNTDPDLPWNYQEQVLLYNYPWARDDVPLPPQVHMGEGFVIVQGVRYELPPGEEPVFNMSMDASEYEDITEQPMSAPDPLEVVSPSSAPGRRRPK